MMTKISKLSNAAKLRAALYALMCAVLGVLAVKKLISQEEIAAYLAVGSALLGVAFYNVSDSEEAPVRDYRQAPLHDDELGY